MHLDDERIQRLLHAELGHAAEEGVRRHLAACAECRARVAEAEEEEERIAKALRAVNHEPPRVSPGVLAMRARRETRSWGRWAAGILLALGAGGAAYAAPGSPLPGWLDGVSAWLEQPGQQARGSGGGTPSKSGSGDAAAARPEGDAVDPDAAGISVLPSERFTVVLPSTHASGVAVVSLTKGAEIVVRAQDDSPKFTTTVNDLTVIAGPDPAVYQIELPESAPWIEIRAGKRRLLLKEGSRISTDAERAGDTYLLRLSSAGS